MGSNSWRAGLVAGALLIAMGTGQGAAGAAAAVTVPCNTAALVSAINTANGAGSPQTLNLAASCTYNLTAVAATGTRGADGLPIITGNITPVGNQTTIRRTAVAKFRLLEVTGTLAVKSLTLRDGDAGQNTGGGILNAQGTVSVDSSTVYANIADNGAGISNDRGGFTLSNSVVRSNSTRPSAGGGGGGIYNDGIMTVTSSNLYFNDANTSGGGIYNELTGKLSVTGTNVQANTAQVRGGGLYNGTNGAATFTNSFIQYNSAEDTGGAIYNATCSCLITLNNTKISLNEPNNCSPTGSVIGCTG
jgi:hypothetical protein